MGRANWWAKYRGRHTAGACGAHELREAVLVQALEAVHYLEVDFAATLLHDEGLPGLSFARHGLISQEGCRNRAYVGSCRSHSSSSGLTRTRCCGRRSRRTDIVDDTVNRG